MFMEAFYIGNSSNKVLEFFFEEGARIFLGAKIISVAWEAPKLKF